MSNLTTRATALALTTAFGFGAVGACTTREALNDLPLAPAPPVFADYDASPDAPESRGLIQYCPSDKCPTGLTTCPTSRFACDVDLRADRANCGACGHACPLPSDGSGYECVEGRCELRCRLDGPRRDCDGIPENGCETPLGTREHCTGCNDTCASEQSCLVQLNYTMACGCKNGTQCDPYSCVDTTKDDAHCGVCGTQCAPDEGPPVPNAYWGCADSSCGHLKCQALFANCDIDVTNGCET